MIFNCFISPHQCYLCEVQLLDKAKDLTSYVLSPCNINSSEIQKFDTVEGVFNLFSKKSFQGVNKLVVGVLDSEFIGQEYLNFKASRTVTVSSICNYKFYQFYEWKKLIILHLYLTQRGQDLICGKSAADKDVGYKTIKVSSIF